MKKLIYILLLLSVYFILDYLNTDQFVHEFPNDIKIIKRRGILPPHGGWDGKNILLYKGKVICDNVTVTSLDATPNSLFYVLSPDRRYLLYINHPTSRFSFYFSLFFFDYSHLFYSEKDWGIFQEQYEIYDIATKNKIGFPNSDENPKTITDGNRQTTTINHDSLTLNGEIIWNDRSVTIKTKEWSFYERNSTKVYFFTKVYFLDMNTEKMFVTSDKLSRVPP